MIADLHADGPCGESVRAQIGCRAREQREQLLPELGVVVDVQRKCFVAADALRLEMRLDVRAVDAVNAIPEPGGFALAQPLTERPAIVLQDIRYGAHSQAREPFLKAGPDERDLGELDPAHELLLGARRDDVNAGAIAVRTVLRVLDGELRDELRRSSAKRDRQSGFANDIAANARRRFS